MEETPICPNCGNEETTLINWSCDYGIREYRCNHCYEEFVVEIS